MKINSLRPLPLKFNKNVLVVVAVLLFLENLVLAFNNLQNKTTILGLKLEGRGLTGLSAKKIKGVIRREAQKNNRPLKFSYKGQVFEVRQVDIGAKVNEEELTKKLLSVGRKGNFLKKILEQNRVLLGFRNLKLQGDISQSLLTIKILIIQDAVNFDPMPPMPDFKGDITKTIPARDGVKVNTDKLTLLISDNIFNPPKNPIPLPTMAVFSAYHNEKELDEIRKAVPKMIKESISIESGEQIFTLTSEDLRLLLTLVERLDARDPNKVMLNLRLDDKKLNQKLGEFAEKVEGVTHAEFDDHDARVAIYAQLYSGKRKIVHIPTGRQLTSQKVLGAANSTGPKVAYLTFDDGPNSIYHPLILDILRFYDVKATFFLVGQNSQRDSEIARRTQAEGHKIGNHSLTHSFLPNLPPNSIIKELQTTNNILKSFNNNEELTLFRPPYGGVNLYVKRGASDLGLKLTLWDVDPRDWSEPPIEELVRRVVSATSNGSDILLHSNHLATVKALPKIIETLKSQNYTFKTLD